MYPFNFVFSCSNKRTTQSSAASANQLTFSQIEELINKYTLELEEQEKVFINQATQVNTWDNLLNNNSKKVVNKKVTFCLSNVFLILFFFFGLRLSI